MIENVELLSPEIEPEIEPEISADKFRQAMRKFAASVTVITTGREKEMHGMTATAVCSVCAEPPTILVVVNRTAHTHPLIAAAGFFTVNFLAQGQQSLAERFSTQHPDPFEGILRNSNKNLNAPVISGAIAFLECRLTNQLDVGTHTIFIGQVVDCDTVDDEPLLYYGGRYSKLAAGAGS